MYSGIERSYAEHFIQLTGAIDMKRLTTVFLALCLSASMLAAHHSPAVFDRTKEIKLVGVVKEFKWSNPHSWIELSVRNAKGELESWAVEMGSPNHLVKAGWRSTTIKSGDEVTIIAHPLRTDEKVGQFVKITLADGKELTER
jgi:hypothetical protein